MTKQSTQPTRRDVLRMGGASLAGALGLSGLSALAPITAQAQTGYRALVCLFLYGGNDGNNMVIPSDSAEHAKYASVRENIAIPRDALVNLPGVSYGLHPAMAPLSAAWSDGALAPVFNVGPTSASSSTGKALSKTELLSLGSGSALMPSGLYSHSDQQILWTAAGTNSTARTGWGGRAAQTMSMANPVMAFGGSGLFGISSAGAGLSLPSSPGSTFGLQGYDQSWWSDDDNRLSALNAMYAGSSSNRMMNALLVQQRSAFDVANRLGGIIKVQRNADGSYAQIDAAFQPYFDGGYDAHLGNQLYMIARMVQDRATVGGSRQIFMASQGGYDTHNGQGGATGYHQRLLGSLAMAMASFYSAMKAIGMSDSVTLFTQSDFGRTWRSNASSGTDHAWGNHHLVMGGGVNGGATYGTYPTLQLLGPTDHGNNQWEDQGRWIPSTSVEQYSATLLSWLGASGSQLGTILPRLSGFSNKHLGFMKA